MAAAHLQCLQGAPAPEIVVRGWEAFVAMPQDARDDVVELALRVFYAPEDPRWERERAELARRHSLAPRQIEIAVNGCGWLVERAAATNLPLQSFRDDVVALCGEAPDAGQEFIQRYEGIRAELRQLITQRSLTDHGKVLVALEWRVDTVSASHRGAQLDTAVIFLTLRYMEAEEQKRITLQLTQPALHELKTFLDRFATSG
jgi:hypothetical protein